MAATVARTAPGDFQRQRKRDSRQQLLAAAAEAFGKRGYFAVSVDEIASEAGVSRMTFYRHFNSKAVLAAELFRQNTAIAMPRFLAIGERDYRDRGAVRAWIAELFAADRASRTMQRVFVQANAEEPGFTERAHDFIAELITSLGRCIPAFALDPGNPEHRRRWMEAWLVLYEILDQGNHSARGAGVAADPLIIDILADRFVAFVDCPEA